MKHCIIATIIEQFTQFKREPTQLLRRTWKCNLGMQGRRQ